VFSAFRAVFLPPLPYIDGDRLVEISKFTPDGRSPATTTIDVHFWRQFSRSFESFGTFAFYHTMTLSVGGEPVSIVARVVEPDLFRTLQALPLLGRVFVPADFDNANPHGLLLTWKIWQSHSPRVPRSAGSELKTMEERVSQSMGGTSPLHDSAWNLRCGCTVSHRDRRLRNDDIFGESASA
jgi:hypothetical protein